MELLDTVSADAIALRLCSLPAAAGSLWAWLVAALATAVGLWRIRAASASSSSTPGAGVVRSVSALVDDDKLQQEQKAPLPSPSPAPAAATDEPRPAAASVSEPSTPSKVRFTAYYGGSGHHDDDGVVDGVRKCGGADDDDEEEDGARGRGVEMVLRRTASYPGMRRSTSPSWEEREMVVRRRSDLGWYRHIDMAALDGSVVRLWDGELTVSPRGRRRRAGLEFQLSV